MGVLLSIPACRALAVLVLQQFVLLAAKVSAFIPGILAERAAEHSHTRL